MKTFWDSRYLDQAYVYGKEPNGFFATHLDRLTPGSLLLPGEGEGRNAVYAAKNGWAVDAFDQSQSGYEKAMGLASEKQVLINYHVCQLEDYSFNSNQYDLVALIFFHVESLYRKYLHQLISESLKPGGTLLLEAFHTTQLERDTGGPKSLALLYDEQTLSNDFAALDTKIMENRLVTLNEGTLHQGEASVIRFIGNKPQ